MSHVDRRRGTYDLKCIVCEKPFTGTKKARFCSDKCRAFEYYNQDERIGSGIATPTKGAIGELIVCASLLGKGFEVFRAQSPACSCDLIVAKNGHLIRIEVRTGNETRTNKIITRRKRICADVLAIVLKDRVIYEGITKSLEEFQWPETDS